jgi:hypothetical protein
MRLEKGLILNILDLNSIPKNTDLWMKEVGFYSDEIVKGKSAVLFYDGLAQMTTTSTVKHVYEDTNNMIITTENSVYYIKKFRNEESI